MANDDLFLDDTTTVTFDDEGLDVLPLITKERTQKFELLLHLIPNLKQHLILCGASGIGKTLLLDMLYDINSDVWQCCFVQGSADLSFETVEAQLTKTMLRNKHESLDSAFHDFQEQHKKVVLIIDDAGLLVPGLMTTLVDYAAGQPALKLIFSLTPQARQTYRTTDKALDNCYLLEIPTLSKRQCALFLRQLAAKPRTYGVLQVMDDKLLDKIYRETQGIPAKLISHFTKLSRGNQNDYTKWMVAFAGLVVLAMAINQGIRYFKEESVGEDTLLTKQIEPVEKTPEISTSTEQQTKNDNDIIVQEFKLDIEKIPSSISANQPTTNESEADGTIEKTSENVTTESVNTDLKVNNENSTTLVEQSPSLETSANTEIIVSELHSINPAQGIQIQPLPDNSNVTHIPLVENNVEKQTIEEKVESQRVDIKPLEQSVNVKKIVETAAVKKKKSKAEKTTRKAGAIKKTLIRDKKAESNKIRYIKAQNAVKVETKTPVKLDANEKINSQPEAEVKTDATLETKVETEVKNISPPPVTGQYTLQLITLSSDEAIANVQKKHPELSKDFRVVKSGSQGQERFSLMYGGFATSEEATQAKQKLPAEFSDALLRKNLTPKP